MNAERKLSTLLSRLLSKPKVAGILVFLFLLLLIGFITNQKYLIIKESQRQEMLSTLNIIKQNIDQSLKNSYTAALTLALTLNDEGKPVNFEKVGEQLINSNSMLKAVQLVPDGIIKYTYPLKGNERVLGLNLFKEPNLVAMGAFKTINYQKMYFSGPIKLRQGGEGIVGRLSLFNNNKFWGFSAVVINLTDFLKQAGVYNNENKKFYFQFSKVNPATGKENFFLHPKMDFAGRTYESIYFPDGDWKLYLIVSDKYSLLFQLIYPLVLGLALAVVCGLLTMKLFKKPEKLRRLVDRQAGKLIETQVKFKTIFDKAPIGIAEVDTQNGSFIQVNDKFRKILGYSDEEFYETDFHSITFPEDLEEGLLKMQKLKAGEIEEFTILKRYKHKEGHLLWANLIVKSLWNDGELSSSHICIIEDITEYKQAEKALSDSFNLVNEQNKRLLNFSYIVSHNLRSHTSNIEAISHLIDIASSEEERKELVQLLKRASGSLNETLMNLNKVVNIQTSINVNVEPLNLKHYLSRTIDTLNEEIVAKGASIKENENCELVVNYNPAYLESILLNFIFNAIRYSHPDRKPLIEINCFKEDDYQVLQISDNGIGIDLEKYGAELFGMYKTFNGNPDSKGIGLFISKNQIDAMGGKVTVSSVINEGTTFNIYFKN
ncbi:MAG: PAS domain S-box protein [Candidatus Pedobacter colombiensis]|uniref:histidine kinase n=1 Tax=Candidatus Pedobacter colombiensis TaxID=3121371 RepID=A0AAJ5W5Q2_9SPHI|nr:PAS domain S-box protein [Pedobacter sp.]WEK17608.1 MAG: PAS domain S-box protein [Pedobacter sp.]